MKKTIVTKPVIKTEDKLINLQISRNLAKTLLSEVECSLGNLIYSDTDFEQTYELYKLLKKKLAA